MVTKICKQCKAEGKTYTVGSSGGARTDMYFPPFRDENGQTHNHDQNVVVFHLECSNGHVWVKSE